MECEKEGLVRPATEVDHIEPHGGDMVKFWDCEKWQALCKSHHSRKTAKENNCPLQLIGKVSGTNLKIKVNCNISERTFNLTLL